MSTHTTIVYHIVFATKDRQPALDSDRRDDLLRYIHGILKQKDCHLFEINAVDDHVHVLMELHPTIALADLLREVKTATSKWIKSNRVFPAFCGWQDGYGAFTVSHSHTGALRQYIQKQEEHHRRVDYREELQRLLERNGIQYEDKYLV